MGRLHLFELEDQGWFPKSIRDAGTDFMRLVAEVGRPYRAIIPRIRRVMEETGNQGILDLCSGAAGPVVAIRQELAANGCDIPVTLTDKFPNYPAFQRARHRSEGLVDFITFPIDATAVPPNVLGFRTLFSGMHHFRPEMAKRILQDAVNQGQPIGVFEIARRHPAHILGTGLIAPALLLSTPFIRPFRWSRLFWTYVLPAAPLFLTWDAIVSCLRAYSLKELHELVDGLECDSYLWEIGVDAAMPAPVTYLVGYPV